VLGILPGHEPPCDVLWFLLRGTAAAMSAAEIESLRQQLADLQLEHRALDTAIQGLAENVYVDQLQMRRLKKRKLQLKDAIERLESKLIPDLNA
jgi:hypothetical protein